MQPPQQPYGTSASGTGQGAGPKPPSRGSSRQRLGPAPPMGTVPAGQHEQHAQGGPQPLQPLQTPPAPDASHAGLPAPAPTPLVGQAYGLAMELAQGAPSGPAPAPGPTHGPARPPARLGAARPLLAAQQPQQPGTAGLQQPAMPGSYQQPGRAHDQFQQAQADKLLQPVGPDGQAPYGLAVELAQGSDALAFLGQAPRPSLSARPASRPGTAGVARLGAPPPPPVPGPGAPPLDPFSLMGLAGGEVRCTLPAVPPWQQLPHVHGMCMHCRPLCQPAHAPASVACPLARLHMQGACICFTSRARLT